MRPHANILAAILLLGAVCGACSSSPQVPHSQHARGLRQFVGSRTQAAGSQMPVVWEEAPAAPPAAPPAKAAASSQPQGKLPTASELTKQAEPKKPAPAPQPAAPASKPPTPAKEQAPTPAPAPATAGPACPDGGAPKLYAASTTRMCVLASATARDGIVWNAVGRQVSYSQAQKCNVATCPDGVKPQVPGAGDAGNTTIVTARSAAKAAASGSASSPPAAAPSAPTIMVIERATERQPGRRLQDALEAEGENQDVFVLMNFASSCFTVCE